VTVVSGVCAGKEGGERPMMCVGGRAGVCFGGGRGGAALLCAVACSGRAGIPGFGLERVSFVSTFLQMRGRRGGGVLG
jgi:hypothetical protein